jgi:shikimate dehydrogenase
VDLVLNATSLGLRGDDPLPLDLSAFPLSSAGAVYDMVYRPAETPFLRQARLAGCRTANGLGMLLYQGAKALEIWSGLPAPVEIMRRALMEAMK